MTYATKHNPQKHAFNIHNPAGLLFSNLIGSTLHVDNKTNEHDEQKIRLSNNVDLGAKYMNSCWVHVIELIQRNFIFRVSIGSKGARDDRSYFVQNW